MTLAFARLRSLLLIAACALAASPAWAQESPTPEAAPPPVDAPPTPAPPAQAPPQAPAEQPAPPADTTTGTGTLRLHVISTRNTYVVMGFDVYSVAERSVVASGTSSDESRGDAVLSFTLPAGHYKIVKAGEPFGTKADFATLWLPGGIVTAFVVVVDSDSAQFRGAGPVTDELPKGTSIAGIRVALNAGGSLTFNQQSNVPGSTSGTTAMVGLFGNFSLVFDRGNHFLGVDSDLALSLVDRPTGSVFPTNDVFKASVLYAYNINNPYIGPYVRGSFKTRVFPGYLYLHDEGNMGAINIARLDGTTETVVFGAEANPDDLRIKVAEPFAPIVLQEEIGVNLKAVSLDLLLLKATVATRLGYGMRQGFMNELFVVEGDGDGSPVNLVEVDDYTTHGPVVGAGANVTFARWLFGSAQFGMMAPLKDKELAGDGLGERLLIDFSGTAGLKLPALTSFLYASFEYSFRLERDGFITSDTQFDHTLMARMNVSLF